MAKAKKKVEEEKVEAPEIKAPRTLNYSLEIRINDLVLEAKARTLGIALNEIVPKLPFRSITKMIMTYSKGKAVHSRIIWPREASLLIRRLGISEDIRKLWGLKLEDDLNNL
jgi:hypothetical protein